MPKNFMDKQHPWRRFVEKLYVSERNKLLFKYFLLLDIRTLEATFCLLLNSVI